MARVLTVNRGASRPNPYKQLHGTGIDKRPIDGPVEVRGPGPKGGGLGSGLVGDFIGDTKHHGGDDQALYAVRREDLDRWAERLGRPLANGWFGENLTTQDLDVNEARIGERWRIGDTVEVQVTSPRTPCATFRGWSGQPGWLKTFTADGRPGAYLRILTAGTIQGGDPIEIVHRPAHDVTVTLTFRALMTEPELLPLLLDAADDLPGELLMTATRAGGVPAG